MKQICLGTIITLIYQSRTRSADTIKSVCGGIFANYGLDINNYNKELPSHLKSGHDAVPGELLTAARSADINVVAKGIEEKLIPLIHQDKHECLFLAIKDVLREDMSISDITLVGVTPGYEKNSILNQDSLYEAMTLANIITYAITQTENDKLKASIKEISKDYVDGFTNSSERVYFLSPHEENDQLSPLKRTLKDPAFDRLFLKATDVTISALSNPTTASVFYLDPTNCKFRFGGLKDFIINNIGKAAKKAAHFCLSEKYRPLVYICSPYSGTITKNVKRARKFCRFALDIGAIPLAPHLLYPQFMDDENPEERYLATHTINY